MPDDELPLGPAAAKLLPMAARVLLDGAVADLEFDYAIPPALDGVGPGSRVSVPLRNRTMTGTVLIIYPAAEAEVPNLKPLLGLLSERVIIPPQLMEFGKWVADYYCAPMESVMRAMLPEAVREENHSEKKRMFARLLRTPTEEEKTLLLKKAPKQAEVLEAMVLAGQALPAATFSGAALKALREKNWIELTEDPVQRDPFEGESFISSKALSLNQWQHEALVTVLEAVRHPQEAKPMLLFGVTGSGKTEVYLQAAHRVLEQGQAVLVLVPEISLTPQTVERFKSRFAEMQDQVAVLHSHLSQGERFDEWHRIQRGRARIVIGARSALFAPLAEIGLIIVDEEHEGSYKQEQPPRYQARDAAVVRARLEGCAILLGSATPALESWHNAQRGKYTLLRLPERADDAKLPLVRVIDMRVEKKRAGKGSPAILSERLRIAIDQRLTKGEQTILFLNRRGFASSVVCQACGHVVKCQHCEVAMTVHRELGRLVCHVCGFQKLNPQKCPECKDPAILLAGYGTERVEETLRKVFPTARMARVDADAMSQKHTLRDTLHAFKTGKLDLMVGTQMIAKGLHFPNVTLVGILNADMGLHIPDFRAGERTFSLLTQVAGRAGRGELMGEVVVQSFTPHHPSIQFARQHDYEGFSEQELEFRRQCGYPPYGHAVLVTLRSERENLADFALTTLHGKLLKVYPGEVLLGEPAPSPLVKSHDQYRFQILIRARQAKQITEPLMTALASMKLPKEVIATVDVDPVNLG
jgi:primosomal protein N' (replication factor Y) (superfamily II helicase)